MRSKKKETFKDLIETYSHKYATIICVYTHSEKRLKLTRPLVLIDHMLLKFAD